MATSAKDAPLNLQERQAEAAPSPWGWAERLKHLLGLDRAIAFTALARAAQILGSTGTVLLILRYLTPVEQGYYYTLFSLISLQTVFELGLSFVILQMAAHECARLTFHADGRVEGDPVARARLASVLRKTLRWYLVAGAVLCASLLPAGEYFFSRHASSAAPVAWHGPWVLAVFATAFLFTVSPFFSFLDGCGQIWQVGRMRLGQALLGVGMSWGALLSHRGLFAPGMVNIGYSIAGLAFLYSRRRLLGGLLRDRTGGASVSWRREVWPFQWRITVTWLSVYLSTSVFTPVLFAYRGPVEAGRLGMSMGVATYLWMMVLAWMSTKATPFGQMIARGEFGRLDRLFFRTLWQSLAVLTIIAAVAELGVMGLRRYLPSIAARIVSPAIFALILLTTLSFYVVQSLAVYLRAHKREPFLWQSAAVAALTCCALPLLVPAWGISGIAATYLLCTGAVGLFTAVAIFRSWRRRRGAEDPHSWTRRPSIA